MTTRTTRTEYDALSRPITVTLNYRPGLNPSADRNVQLLSRHDAAGNVTWQRDALGRWTKFDYDALNRPIAMTLNYENGNPLTVDVANQGWTDGSDTDIISVTRYDAGGQLERTIDNYVDGAFTATQPITDQITLFQYDAFSRVVMTTLNYDPPTLGTRTDTNRVSVSAYDRSTMRLVGQRDALGRWVSMQYDLLGRVATTIQNCTGSGAPASCGSMTADANVPTTTHYDELGRPFETIDALGHLAQTRYDFLGRPNATIQNYVAPGAPTTAITNVTTLTDYDGLGRATAMTDALGNVTLNDYNGLHQTVVVTDSMGRVTRMGYDGMGALRWKQRPDGQLTVMQLDGLGRTVATIVNYDDGALGMNEPSDQDLVSSTVYDAAGRRVRSIDAASRATAFGYDLQDRLVSVTENAASGACAAAPCNVVTQYQYDRAGNRTAIVDARGNVRTFSYDAASQPVAADDPVHPPTSWEYDAGGRMTVQHDPRGITDTLSFAYDGLDRRTQTSASSMITITAQYDALSRRTSLSDGTGATSFAHDPLGRITQVTAPVPGAVGYGYDANGQRTQLTYPNSGPSMQYAYWPDGQLRFVTDTTTLASYSYDQLGRLDTLTRANGATTSYSYDGADRLLESTTEVSGTTVSAFELNLTAANGRLFFSADDGVHGNELWVSDGTATGTILVADIMVGSTGANPSNLSGSAGRLFLVADDGVHGGELWLHTPSASRIITYAYDGLQRLASAVESPGTTSTYSYDDAGNRTAVFLNGTRVLSQTFDAADQLVGASYDAAGNLLSDGTTSFAYDALNRLTLQGTSTHTYNGDGVLVASGATTHIRPRPPGRPRRHHPHLVHSRRPRQPAPDPRRQWRGARHAE